MMGNTDDMLSFNNLYEQDVHDVSFSYNCEDLFVYIV